MPVSPHRWCKRERESERKAPASGWVCSIHTGSSRLPDGPRLTQPCLLPPPPAPFPPCSSPPASPAAPQPPPAASKLPPAPFANSDCFHFAELWLHGAHHLSEFRLNSHFSVPDLNTPPLCLSRQGLSLSRLPVPWALEAPRLCLQGGSSGGFTVSCLTLCPQSPGRGARSSRQTLWTPQPYVHHSSTRKHPASAKGTQEAPRRTWRGWPWFQSRARDRGPP